MKDHNRPVMISWRFLCFTKPNSAYDFALTDILHFLRYLPGEQQENLEVQQTHWRPHTAHPPRLEGLQVDGCEGHSTIQQEEKKKKKSRKAERKEEESSRGKERGDFLWCAAMETASWVGWRWRLVGRGKTSGARRLRGERGGGCKRSRIITLCKDLNLDKKQHIIPIFWSI